MKSGELIARMPVEIARFSGKGVVESYTIIPRDRAPKGFEYLGPYALAHVRLEEGVMVTAILADVDLDNIYIGMKVEMVTRKKRDLGDEGILVYGYSFRPPIPETNEILAEMMARIEAEEYEFILQKKTEGHKKAPG